MLVAHVVHLGIIRTVTHLAMSPVLIVERDASRQPRGTLEVLRVDIFALPISVNALVAYFFILVYSLLERSEFPAFLARHPALVFPRIAVKRFSHKECIRL